MKSFARIVAAATLGIAVTMTLIQMQKPAPPKTEIVVVAVDESGNDPVRAELRRCQNLGVAGADDARCLRAWAEMRSRFFRSSVSANPALREDAAPPIPNPAIDEDGLGDTPVKSPIAGKN
ncbi:putative entry exclusion protein TrbK-alt [Sphingorhabdus sp. YGSMI21]|uniref:putative entry exclusion protein TrbK-alt n=1 Tax=Sphingorhabdus sp. YGSMI21 TaxID=2077182 RepID=UPI000C1F0BF4|nr:putative entry exclusion protein TrbK-alt [Sphingorhabdus sp. YGSMI21]ATW05284.1 hypothetical protein CHN51_18435 [Sphingorhabdus sp. YGSMI21]